ncbi:hypothetical protein RQ846_18940 [Roseomonas mucosa]|uniref:alginate O-acetyltransferase AlgX-related protein n=1 Tax=Roseomonas mucosa TaxID=207340 RepID=UPI0028CF5FA6|nr:hypothetical protein [Roseomonas mucosa]MDT8291793.1 hypothetical protein [Roseomonas mucosa]
MDDGLQIENEVLIGGRGELFLARGAHSVLQFARGAVTPNAASVANMKANLDSRRERADKAGTRYMHLVAPEKYQLYRDDFPIQNPKSLAHFYMEAGCKGISYPVEELAGGDEDRSYFRTDTHWAAHGLMRVALLIGARAGIPQDRLNRAREEMLAALAPAPEEFFGDLGRKLVPPRGEVQLLLRPSHSLASEENGIGHDYTRPVNDGRLIVTNSLHPEAAGTVLIFGDSYLFHALSYLSYLFCRSVFCRTRFYHDEMVVMAKPDIVVTQAAERYLGFVHADTTAPPFLMLPYLLGRAPSFSPRAAQTIALGLAGGRKVDFGLFQPR